MFLKTISCYGRLEIQDEFSCLTFRQLLPVFDENLISFSLSVTEGSKIMSEVKYSVIKCGIY